MNTCIQSPCVKNYVTNTVEKNTLLKKIHYFVNLVILKFFVQFSQMTKMIVTCFLFLFCFVFWWKSTI